jgi:hypothetical protein
MKQEENHAKKWMKEDVAFVLNNDIDFVIWGVFSSAKEVKEL